MRTSSAEYLGQLTGLRFLAALHVVFFHFRDLALSDAPAGIYEVANKGYVSVGLFFVLSGFILAHSYLGSRGRTTIDRWSFWTARFARIYPVYVLSFLIAAPAVGSLIFGSGGFSWSPYGPIPGLALIATLGQGWTLLPAQAFGWPSWSFAVATLDWNFPVWSLGAEGFFYLVFPFVAPLLARARTGTLMVFLAIFWVLAVAPPLVYGILPGASYPSDHAIGAWNWVINYSPLFRLPEFLFGIVLGHLYARYPGNQRTQSRMFGAAEVALPVLALGVLVLGLVKIMAIPGLLLANGLFDPLFGLIVYGLAVSDRGLAWLLARQPFLILGEASYALYVLHIPLWTALGDGAQFLLGMQFNPQTIGFFTIYLTTTIAIAVAVFLVWERPARSLLRRALMQRRPRREEWLVGATR